MIPRPRNLFTRTLYVLPAAVAGLLATFVRPAQPASAVDLASRSTARPASTVDPAAVRTILAGNPDPKFWDPPGECTVDNAGRSKRTPRLHREFHREICEAANYMGIDPLLLAATIQHEGSGRAKVDTDAWRVTEYGSWEAGRFSGLPDKPSTVGYGQMRPDVAAEVIKKFWGKSYDERQIAKSLIEDPRFAIYMTAAYLTDLKSTFGLTNKQTFIMYALGAAGYEELTNTGWSGTVATERGTKYDQLLDQIVRESGYYHGPGTNEPVTFEVDTATSSWVLA